MISRLLHRIWLDEPMPEPFAVFGEQWAETHPGWRVVEWTDSATLPPLVNQAAFDAAETLYPSDHKRFRADLLRLELLLLYGGVYVDTDAQPARSLDPLREHSCFVGPSPQHVRGDHPLTQAVVGATPDHPFIWALVDGIPDALAEHGHRTLAQSVGPWHVTRTLRGGDFDVTVVEDLYERWVVHHWNNGLRKRGQGLA